VTPLYPQKLALTSPTGGGRSVGIVRSRTRATEFLRTSTHVSTEFQSLTLDGVRDRYCLHLQLHLRLPYTPKKFWRIWYSV